MRFALPLFAVLAAPTVGHAKVAAASATSFEIVSEVEVKASPAELWSSLVAPARWWNGSHSWSGDAANLSLEPRAGGCFCERWSGGSAEHLRVVYVDPGKVIRMAGALGPLQTEAVAGAISWTVEPAGGGATLKLRYAVSGAFPGGLDRVAPAVDRVLLEQLARLKAAAEKR